MKIKVLTLNVWHGGKLWDEMIGFLQSENPDVLLLQEAHAPLGATTIPQQRTLEEFRKLLDYPVDDFAPQYNWDFKGQRVAHGSAIFSKLPLIKRHRQVFIEYPFNENFVDDPKNYPTIPRNLEHLTLDAGGTAIDVFNLHGVWDLNGTNDSPQRMRMSEVVIQNVKDLTNVILAGDTNAQRHCRAILDIEEHLVNVFGDELPTSFNVRHKDLEKFPGYATATVDMMFTSPNLKVVDHYCPQVDASDHLPLVAVVEVPTV
jgi:endonuclease/exonuclease/phosphatase family metal-dependent hydrolase